VWTGLDLVEAAMRTGRGAQAAAHAAALREAALAARSPRLDFVAAACAATAASSMRSTGLFEAVLARPTARQWPFDLARVQLAYGEQLRRGHAAAAGRVQLAAPAQRSNSSERVPGGPRRRRAARHGPNRDEVVTTVLTTQEYEIAALAAAGLTNKQIGEQLFLSHRTVSTHLYRTFPSSVSGPGPHCGTRWPRCRRRQGCPVKQPGRLSHRPARSPPRETAPAPAH